MTTTHAIPDTFVEMQAVLGDLGPAVIVSHSGLTVPASSLTLPAVSATGYVVATGPPVRLVYVSQPAVSLTIAGGDGQYWLAVHTDLSTAVAGWTRRAGSHFLWQVNATQPANPAQALVFCQITVASGVISAVAPLAPVTSQPMSRQNSHAVAITGGNAALGTLSCIVLGINTTAPTPPTHLAVGGGMYVGGLTNLAGNTEITGTTHITLPVGINTTPPTPPTYLAVGGGAYVAGLGNFGGNIVGAGSLNITGLSQLMGGSGLGTAPVAGFQTALQFDRSSTHGLMVRGVTNDASNSHVQFLNMAGSVVGFIQCTATTTAYNTSSDRRLKDAITPLTGALEVIKALNPVSHLWKADGSPGVGFVADEVQQVVGGVVSGEPDAVDAAGQIVPQGMDLSKLVPWLTAALKETLAQVEALTARVALLEEALA